MKRFLTLCLPVFAVLWALSSCGCDDGRDVDLVFINGSDAVVTAVMADFGTHSTGSQHADSSPLKRDESFGFESGGSYPATVAVYEDLGWKELGSVTIRKAPPEGKRWYVTARDGSNGLTLTVDAG